MNANPKDYFRHGIFFNLYGLFKYLPSPLGDVLRYLIIKIFIKEIGRVRIYEGVTFWYPERIKIGDKVTLNEWVYLNGYGGLTIEDGVRIGERTSIITSDHTFEKKDIPIYQQAIIGSQVIIEKNVWIGCHVVILKGIRIGEGAVIAAGAVVTKDVPSFSVVAGVPAKIIKQR
ncbi:MAG TPA: acyltransferase [bacterium]|nr:acyltransferase [bacterium]